MRLSSLLRRPLALCTNAVRGELGESSVSNFRENIADDSPDPYENNTSLVPASLSVVFLYNNNNHLNQMLKGKNNKLTIWQLWQNMGRLEKTFSVTTLVVIG